MNNGIDDVKLDTNIPTKYCLCVSFIVLLVIIVFLHRKIVHKHDKFHYGVKH